MSSRNLTQHEMEIWELLAQAIPRGESDAIAKLMGVSGQTVRSWRSDPDTDENGSKDPLGRRSPADWIVQFLTAVYSRHPQGARDIRDLISRKVDEMDAIHGHEEMIAAREAANEARELAEKIIALTDKMRIEK